MGPSRRLIANLLLLLLACWLAFLDRCLLSTGNASLNSEIAFAIAIQISMIVLLLMGVNGRLPIVLDMARATAAIRLKLFVFGIPLVLLLLSPAMISDAIYGARYGATEKSLIHAHVWADLSCCLNPLW